MNDELEFFKEQSMKALPPATPQAAIPAHQHKGEVVALEYGRCGLRTFEFDLRYGFISVAAGPGHWDDGTCTARCYAGKMYYASGTPEGQHEAPNENCHCGIYACLTLENLVGQYLTESLQIVAVIAAQGQTIIGDVGFQTQYARVIAYWLGSVDAYHMNPLVSYTRSTQRSHMREVARQMEHVAGTQFRSAKRFPRIDHMLYEYGFPQPPNGFYEAFGMTGPHRRYPEAERRVGSSFLRHAMNWPNPFI